MFGSARSFSRGQLNSAITYLVEGDSPKREAAIKPRFGVGDKVLVKNVPTIEHTRLPGYLRNHIGIIETVYRATTLISHPPGPTE
jgi:nitrile hydratase subunit beta